MSTPNQQYYLNNLLPRQKKRQPLQHIDPWQPPWFYMTCVVHHPRTEKDHALIDCLAQFFALQVTADKSHDAIRRTSMRVCDILQEYHRRAPKPDTRDTYSIAHKLTIPDAIIDTVPCSQILWEDTDAEIIPSYAEHSIRYPRETYVTQISIDGTDDYGWFLLQDLDATLDENAYLVYASSFDVAGDLASQHRKTRIMYQDPDTLNSHELNIRRELNRGKEIIISFAAGSIEGPSTVPEDPLTYITTRTIEVRMQQIPRKKVTVN